MVDKSVLGIHSKESALKRFALSNEWIGIGYNRRIFQKGYGQKKQTKVEIRTSNWKRIRWRFSRKQRSFDNGAIHMHICQKSAPKTPWWSPVPRRVQMHFSHWMRCFNANFFAEMKGSWRATQLVAKQWRNRTQSPENDGFLTGWKTADAINP